MGSLTRAVYSGRPPLVHTPRVTCKNAYPLGRFSFHFSHPTAHQPTLSTYLPSSPTASDTLSTRFVLPCFLSCGSNSLYFCYAVRAHTFSITITPRTNRCHKPSSVPYLLPIGLVFSSSCLCSFPQNISPFPLGAFSRFPTRLVFDTSPQVVCKNGKLKPGSLHWTGDHLSTDSHRFFFPPPRGTRPSQTRRGQQRGSYV